MFQVGWGHNLTSSLEGEEDWSVREFSQDHMTGDYKKYNKTKPDGIILAAEDSEPENSCLFV